MSISKKTKKRTLRIGVVLLAVIVALVSAFFIYTANYYRATDAAYEALKSEDGIEVTQTENKVVYNVKNSTQGIVFYPGAKVEYTAYAPLMKEFARQGISGVLLKVNFNLAILDEDAANGASDLLPNTKQWYIAGHSLGGAIGAMYFKKHIDSFDGLILLAAYSTENISDHSKKVLCVYGENDGVINRENYEKNKSNLPKDFQEVVISGGCHAYFGCYGAQDGDGSPTITNQEQISQTAVAVNNFIQA